LQKKEESKIGKKGVKSEGKSVAVKKKGLKDTPVEDQKDQKNLQNMTEGDFFELGIPSPLHPQGLGKGTHSYTVHLSFSTLDMSLEVNLAKRAYWLKKPVIDTIKKRNFGWGSKDDSEGPAKAWQEILVTYGLSDCALSE
jgi:hypothetical protein